MISYSFYLKIAHYVAHLILYLLVTAYQTVKALIYDTEEFEAGVEYERSARLYEVHYRGQPKKVVVLHRRHFITSFLKRLHPNYALRPHVSLMSVTDHEAIFCVPEDDINIYDAKQRTFLFDAHFKMARRLLIMPISSMLKLAEKLGDPKLKVVWVHHPGRCGSTALVQAFDSMPGAYSISETHAMFSLRQMYLYKNLSAHMDTKKSNRYRQLFQSTVRLILKPPLLEDASVVLYKSQAMGASVQDAELLADLFPDFKQVFLYRNAQPQIVSLHKIIGETDLIFRLTSFLWQNPVLRTLFPDSYPQQLIYNACDCPEHTEWLFSDEVVNEVSRFGGLAIGWAVLAHHYQKALKNVTDDKLIGMKYEDMQADRDRFMKILLDYAGISLSENGWNQTMRALDSHSHQNSYVNPKKVAGLKVVVTPNLVVEANKYLDFYGMPKFDQDCTLERTKSSEPELLKPDVMNVD